MGRRGGLLPPARPTTTALLLCLALPSTRPFVLTPVAMSSTPREGRPFSTRQLKIGDRPAPFETMSSSGPTVEAAIRSLREAVSPDGQGFEVTGGGGSKGVATTRTAMGLLFYTRCGEKDGAPVGMAGSRNGHPFQDDGPGSSGVREELSQLHGRLPFVDHIIASPALATTTSEHGYDDAQTTSFEASERSACSVTLVLMNNPEIKVTPFVLGEDFASSGLAAGGTSSLLRKDDAIEDAVNQALLEQRASSCDDGVSDASAAASAPVGQFGSICLAFGGGSSADGGNAECMSQLRRLNGILRRARPTSSGTKFVDDGSAGGGGGVSGGVSGGGGRDCKRCPLVASATMTEAGDETIVSTWDERRGTFRTAAGAVVGALVSASPESTTAAFQLVHAGDHVPLRGSQFRIKRMQGGDIAEVMPVRPLTADEHMRPRCGDGAIAAADWCRDAVVAATWFEKIAMQSAIGVGVLRRVNPDSRTRNCHILSREAHHQEGVIPYLPADACIGIAEVETGGSLLLTPPCSGDALAEHVHPSGFTWRGGAATAGGEAAATTVKGLRPGDLCDFRAIGSLATIQAEHDAYAWLHAARLSASILRPASGNEDGGSDRDSDSSGGAAASASTSGVQGIQGCFAAGAVGRFGEAFVREGCDDVAGAAAEHGGCPAVGIVPGMQVVSVDNEMVTCSTNACLASVYVCGQVGGGP